MTSKGEARTGAARIGMAGVDRPGMVGRCEVGRDGDGQGEAWNGRQTMTAAQRHMEKIASLQCICCRLLGMKQETRTYVHHIRGEDREQRNDWLTLPLCWPCHQGVNGIHMDKTYLRQLKMSEWGLLARVIEELEQG